MLKKPDIGSLENLEQIDKDRLEKVWQLLSTVQSKFLVTETVNRTGFKKGHVSNILSGRIPMSPNFYDTFLKKFAKTIRPDIEIKKADAGKELSRLVALTINHEAKLNLISKVLNISDLEIEKEISSLYDEYLNRQKQA